MPYTVTPTALPEVLILEPKVFGDARGFFFESFNQRDFAQATELVRGMARAAGVPARLLPVPVWALKAGGNVAG